MVVDLDRRKLVAFGTSGALWASAIFVFSLGDPMIIAASAVYFLVFTLAVSVNRLAVPAVSAAWVSAMLLFGMVLAGADDDTMVGGVIVGAVSLGTVVVGGWSTIGFLVLLLVDPARRKPVA